MPVADGHGGVLVETEPHPITDVELELAVLLVVCELHDPLSLKEPIMDFCQEYVPVPELVIHRRNPHCPRKHRQQCWRRPTVDNLKWHSLQSRLE
jgi:hypothetical protein